MSNDHVEICLVERFAGVTDRGINKIDNQDSLAMATVEILVSPVDVPPIYIVVLCDGVSSSASGASASDVAAKTALTSLKQAFERNPDTNTETAIRDAIRLANEAVCGIGWNPNGTEDPPATTIVAAVVQNSTAIISWVGDSRAYWLNENESGVLTRDDSWVNAMIDSGRMTEEEALTSPNQHALVRCLGGEANNAIVPTEPSFATLHMPRGTSLVLCSDGFWNYAPTPENVARLVRRTPHGNSLAAARHLINFAIAQGGHDNITVALLAL
jgi:serine/threonine protein phosphatase PrpC